MVINMRRNERIKEVKDHMVRTHRDHLLADHGALWGAIEQEIVALQEENEALKECVEALEDKLKTAVKYNITSHRAGSNQDVRIT